MLCKCADIDSSLSGKYGRFEGLVGKKGEQEKEKSGQHLTPQNALTAFLLLQIIRSVHLASLFARLCLIRA